jgi:inward rectifier potassium channel
VTVRRSVFIRRDAEAPRYTLVRQGTFEVRKTGTSRFDFKDPYHLAVALPWSAFVVCALLALLLINLTFAMLYVLRPGSVNNLSSGNFLYAFFFSMETMSTVGYGEMSPSSVYGYIVACCEMVVGMAFLALLTGLLFVRFSQSRPGILFAENAVISTHNGRPTLMIRVGNARVNMLTEATASLSVLLKETSDEGQVFRRYHDLRLICQRLPAFPLTWTLMHKIDATSPLYGYDPDKLRADWGRLFLSVEARDPKLGRKVQELCDYGDQRILFGAHYVDAVMYDDKGVPTADLSMLGRVERLRAMAG